MNPIENHINFGGNLYQCLTLPLSRMYIRIQHKDRARDNTTPISSFSSRLKLLPFKILFIILLFFSSYKIHALPAQATTENLSGIQYDLPIEINAAGMNSNLKIDFSKATVVHQFADSGRSIDVLFHCTFVNSARDLKEFHFVVTCLDCEGNAIGETFYWPWMPQEMSLASGEIFYFRNDTQWGAISLPQIERVAKVVVSLEVVEDSENSRKFKIDPPANISWECPKGAFESLNFSIRKELRGQEPNTQTITHKILLRLQNAGETPVNKLTLQIVWFDRDSVPIKSSELPLISKGESPLSAKQSALFLLYEDFVSLPLSSQRPFVSFELRVKQVL